MFSFSEPKLKLLVLAAVFGDTRLLGETTNDSIKLGGLLVSGSLTTGDLVNSFGIDGTLQMHNDGLINVESKHSTRESSCFTSELNEGNEIELIPVLAPHLEPVLELMLSNSNLNLFVSGREKLSYLDEKIEQLMDELFEFLEITRIGDKTHYVENEKVVDVANKISYVLQSLLEGDSFFNEPSTIAFVDYVRTNELFI